MIVFDWQFHAQTSIEIDLNQIFKMGIVNLRN